MPDLHHAVQMPLFALMRVCKACHAEKPLDQFYRDRNTYHWECKACFNARCSARKKELRRARRPIQPLMLPGMKQCSICKAVKSLEQFYRRNGRPSGYKAACKTCSDARYDAHRHKNTGSRRAVWEKAARTGYKYCSSCHTDKRLCEFPRRNKVKIGLAPACKECMSKQHQKYSERQRIRRLRLRHSDPVPYRESRRRRYARKRGVAIGKVSYTRILLRDGHCCYICQQAILPDQEIHFDHVVPLSRGGSHSEENIKPTHRICNLRKSNKLLDEMTDAQRRGIA